jgi:hypothetical protein
VHFQDNSGYLSWFTIIWLLRNSYDKDDNGGTHKVVKRDIRNTSWWKKR